MSIGVQKDLGKWAMLVILKTVQARVNSEKTLNPHLSRYILSNSFYHSKHLFG